MATYLGTIGNDTIIGSSGNDTIEGDRGADSISGGGGHDSIQGHQGDDWISGGAGDDDLWGIYGHDTILGGAGNDTFTSEEGADYMDGGDGIDLLSNNSQYNPTFNLSVTTPQLIAGEWDTILNFENIYSAAGNSHLTGSSVANVLETWDGNDTLIGLAGNDTLKASYGADSLDGGAGDDWLIPDAWALRDQFGDRIVTGSGFDIIQIEGSNGNADAAAGGHTSILEQILDWDVHDTLYFVEGRTGGAEAYSEATASSYDEALAYAKAVYSTGIRYSAVQVGADVFVFAPRYGDAVVLVNRTLADINFTNVTYGAYDTLRPTSGDDVRIADPTHPEIHGGEGNDTLTTTAGYTGTTLLRGDEGNDSLSGGAQFDDLHGNMGNDTLRGGQGDDWVVGGKDEDLLFGDAGGDIVLGNLGGDTLYGGEGNDVVRGGQGDDIVSGQDGDDFVSGDRGNDRMAGGAGADTFHSFGDAGIDWIEDFKASEGDRVNLLPGSVYTVSQVGAHVYVDIDGGARLIVADTLLANLPAGWLYVG